MLAYHGLNRGIMKHAEVSKDIQWHEIASRTNKKVWRAALDSRDVVLDVVEDHIPGSVWHEIRERERDGLST